MSRSLRVLVAAALMALPVFDAPVSAELFETVPAASFNVVGEASWYSSGGLVVSDHYSRFCVDSYCEFIAAAGLPGGSTVAGLEIDACNTNDELQIEYSLIRVPSGENGDFVVVASGTVEADVGCVFRKAATSMPAAAVVNQFAFTYLLRVRVLADLFCALDFEKPCPGFNQRFNAVRVYYTAPTSGVVQPSSPTASPVFP